MAPLDPKYTNISHPKTQETTHRPPAAKTDSKAPRNAGSVDRFEKNPTTLADGQLSRQVKGLENLSFKNGNASPAPVVKQHSPNSTSGKKKRVKTRTVKRRRVPAKPSVPSTPPKSSKGKGMVQFANGANTFRQGVQNVYHQNYGEGISQVVGGTADMADALPEGVKKGSKVGKKFLKHAGPAAAVTCAGIDANDARKAYNRGDSATTIEESANVVAGVVGLSPAAPAAWAYTLLDAGMEVTGADQQMIKDLDRCFMNKETNLASQKQDVYFRSNARMLMNMKPADRRALRVRNKREFAQGLQELKRQASQLQNPQSRQRAFQFIELVKRDITVSRP